MRVFWQRARFSLAAVFLVALTFFGFSFSYASSFPSASAADSAQALPLTPLVIEGGGKRLSFKVGVARTSDEHNQGLMYRLSMPVDEGMLFEFERAVQIAMWMKNTYISLDMIFIDEDGIIVDIAKSTTPHSEEPITSAQEILAVLEINGGLSDRFGIRLGDRVVRAVKP